MTNTIQVWNTTIIGDEECDVEYTFKYTPPSKGSTDYFGQKVEPDYPAEFRFVSATDSDGNKVEVEPEDIEAAEAIAADEVESEQEDWIESEEEDWTWKNYSVSLSDSTLLSG